MSRLRPVCPVRTRSILHLSSGHSFSPRFARPVIISSNICFRYMSYTTSSAPPSEPNAKDSDSSSPQTEDEKMQRLRHIAETDIIPKELELFAFAAAGMVGFRIFVDSTFLWRAFKLFFLTRQNESTRNLWAGWKRIWDTVQNDKKELRELDQLLGGILSRIVNRAEEEVKRGRRGGGSNSTKAYRDYLNIKSGVDPIDVAIRLATLLHSWENVGEVAKVQYAETRKAVGLPPDNKAGE
ncbi:hypothetical protein GYMLUDRAFT_41651 [Collybiopsis luxurians FD-317 M1]|uniref:Uncharacterized protein n=1 Tax=Collybiopsis luxurians FD-317 M1 TaxID=944289 RepID=A0A0D0D0Z7_9AGAR|nr:hypothetical protein GYMLUDRAFT_41651 [Collybiopsis luxurians FD-317 M1]